MDLKFTLISVKCLLGHLDLYGPIVDGCGFSIFIVVVVFATSSYTGLLTYISPTHSLATIYIILSCRSLMRKVCKSLIISRFSPHMSHDSKVLVGVKL